MKYCPRKKCEIAFKKSGVNTRLERDWVPSGLRGGGDFLLLFSQLKILFLPFSRGFLSWITDGLPSSQPTAQVQCNAVDPVMDFVRPLTSSTLWSTRQEQPPEPFTLILYVDDIVVSEWRHDGLLGFGKNIVWCFHVLGVNTSCITP